MGINLSKICCQDQEGDKTYHVDLQKKVYKESKRGESITSEDTPTQDNEKIIKLQSKTRQFLSKEKYMQNVLEKNMQEFQENLASVGTEITENEMNSKISEKVKSLEDTISPFTPTDKEMQQYKHTFHRGPIQFNDGSVYKGSWSSTNTRKGYGTFINSLGHKYEGFWNNEKLDGRGRFIDDKGNYYEGEWKDGMANGKGVIITPHVRYVGTWKDDLQDGFGEEFFVDGDYYQGEYKNGVKNGRGKFFWKDGSSYDGEFVNSTISGKGFFKWSDGRSFEGDWENNKMHGHGVYIWPEGKKYVGEYRREKKEGFGTYFFNDNKYYKGEWLDNKQHGTGIYFINGNSYRVQYRFGKLIQRVLEAKNEEVVKAISPDPDTENEHENIQLPAPLQNDHIDGNLHMYLTNKISEEAIHANPNHRAN